MRGEVLSAMLPCLKENFGNPDSLHSYGRKAAHAVTEARDLIASVLGTKPSEVYFTSGGTEADNWAIRGIGTGDVLCSPIEHAAVLSALSVSGRRSGGECRVSENGIVQTDFAATMSEETSLVSVMAVNNETGCIQPIEKIAPLVHARGGYLFSDCVQAACTLSLKEILLHADAISLSSHKIGGPKGVGVIVVKKGVPLKGLLVGGEQERGLRGGTLNVAGIVGFAQALRLAQEEREEFSARTGALRDLFEEKICAALGSEVRVDGEHRTSNISHLTFARGGGAFLNVLDLRGVACSGGAACSAHAALPSHVLMAMGRSEEEARRGVRFSFGRKTAREEVLFAADTVIDAYRNF